MAWDASRFQNDIGLWVVRSGALDIRGTPKKGWTRRGMHATWARTDEMYIAPTSMDDYEVRRWYAGDPIPRIDPRVPAAEIVNVTRDIVIEGDTEAVLALRNAIDDAEIDMAAEIAALFGPLQRLLATPLRHVLDVAQQLSGVALTPADRPRGF